MEGFFSGTVILLYFISHYAAEPIFVLSCFLSALYGAAVMSFLAFGACGRMIAAKRRARRFLHKGVIAGGDRELFYKRCVSRTVPSFRAAYALFLRGEISAEALAAEGARSIRVRKSLLKGGSVGVCALACLSVFLTFYFIVPIGETLLRTAVCAFHNAVGAVSLHFLLYAYHLSGERAAAAFSEIAEGRILREKGTGGGVESEGRSKLSLFGEKGGVDLFPPRREEENEDVVALREMLRELDRR